MADTLIDLRDVIATLQPVIDYTGPSDSGPPPIGTTPGDAPYVVTVNLRGRGKVVPDQVRLLCYSQRDAVQFAQAILSLTGSVPPPT